MSQSALGEQFAEHIANFRDRFHEEGYHDPYQCEGQCHEASVRFAEQLDAAGVRNHRIMEFEGEHDPYEGSEDRATHFANVIGRRGGGTVVDWTARQFSGDNYENERTRELVGYPHVEPMSKYKRRFAWTSATTRQT